MTIELAEKKAARAEYRRRYRSKLMAAGLCIEGCGNAREAGPRCRACKDKARAINVNRRSRSGCCNQCGNAGFGETSRCPDCLEYARKYNQKNQLAEGGRWLHNTATATRCVASGWDGRDKRLTSKHFTWTHLDFVARFPLYGQGESDLVIDHIIARAAAERADNTVDEAFAALVLGLENIQLLTSQQNSFKGKNNDARCVARALELRSQGMEGAALFHQLNAEFRAEGLAAQDIQPVQTGGA